MADNAYICDGCGELVHGVVKGKLVHRNYLSLKHATGSLQMQSPQTHKGYYVHVTRAPSQDLAFCVKPGWPCLQSYVDRKVAQQNFRREQALRAEASSGREYVAPRPKPGDPEYENGTGP